MVGPIVIIEPARVHYEGVGDVLEVWCEHVVLQGAFIVIHADRFGELLDCLA